MRHFNQSESTSKHHPRTSIEIHEWPPEKTPTQPVETPLNTNFQTRIKSVRPIKIQKAAPWVESWWTPLERELTVNTDAVEINRYKKPANLSRFGNPQRLKKYPTNFNIFETVKESSIVEKPHAYY
jgi:hypothetical protein